MKKLQEKLLNVRQEPRVLIVFLRETSREASRGITEGIFKGISEGAPRGIL